MTEHGSGVPTDPQEQPRIGPVPGPAGVTELVHGRGFLFEHIVLNLGFIVVTCAIVWGVLSRYVTEQAATWVQEVTSIAFAWVVFVGAAEVHRSGRHVSVNILTAFLPAKVQAVLAVVVEIFVAFYCFYVAWLSLQQTIVSNSATTPMLDIPLSVRFAGLAAGFLLMGLRSLQRLLSQLRHTRGLR